MLDRPLLQPLWQRWGYLRDKSYVAVAATHMSVDIMNNGRTVLVAILAELLALRNAQLGLLLLIYNLGSALSQPLFGWVADRVGARWLVLGGLAWMIAFYGAAAVIPPWPALLAVTAASLGSGAFHPSGTKVASERSHTHRTQATAVFFMMGQVGLFLGPILAGFLMEAYGRIGYIVLPLLSLAVLTATLFWLREVPVEQPTVAARPKGTGRAATRSNRLRAVLPLILVIIATNTVSYSALNFAPKLFAELGFSASYLGWVAGLYMLGSAAGGLVGGSLADRIGGKPVMQLALFGMLLPVYFYVPAADTWRLVLLLVAGFFGGMPHSILVLQAQTLLPGRRAFASGLTLGFMFFTGAVGSYILGIVADEIGLAVALQAVVILPACALLASFALPRRTTAAAAG